jgi:muconate cycloisomerase
VFSPLLAGSTYGHPREALAVMEAAAYGVPFTKGALDTAIWDMWARRQNVSALSLFADRTPVTEIPTRASVGCYGVSQTVRIATEFHRAGIRTLKFKVGMPGIDDAARLKAVRVALGESVDFTIDANGGYPTWGAAVAAIERMLPYDLALVEQPTPRERIHLLGEVRRRISVPVLADESVFNLQQLHEILDRDACDFISLYPGKNGGFTNSLEMARLAQAAGKACTLGCNLETDLGQAAMAALAAGLSAFSVDELACDLPAAVFYERSATREPLALRNGKVGVPSGPGFGVTPLCFT